jgi:LysM repeat protein
MQLKQLIRVRMVLFVAVLIVAFVLPAAAHAQGGVHVVQRGETLYSIARRYGTSVTTLVQANGLRNANFIWVGQRLTIPGSGGGGGSSSGGGSGLHVVRWGETLYSIARRYGTSVTALVQANALRSANYIYAGQRLRIPGGGGGSSGGGGSAPSGGGVHVVQRGETLYSIARRRWIDVDLSSQTVRAYQGNVAVRSMVVSTGISRYPTPPGRFRIYAKYPSVNMSGPGYYLPGVPHTMFFYKGYALHGTYWHSNFGRPMSHGCINLTRADAAWLYSWAAVGTQVVIHW